MILIARFEPISTFELRPSNTTKTGGKTLLCPTPYAIRMALLDRMIRQHGIGYGRDQFPAIRDLGIAIQPPSRVAVNRTFQKILRPPFSNGSWISTIAMREFCIPTGNLGIAFDTDEEMVSELAATLSAVNYFGQRGSFFQLVDLVQTDQIPAGFVDVTRPTQTLQLGFLQRMDDIEQNASFEDVNTYNPKSSGGRRSYNVVFPYILDHHGSNHTIWRWEGPQP